MSEIVGIGANVYDTLICVSKYPDEDTKLKADKLMRCGGGPTATGLVAAAKLGAECEFIGNFTDDEGGVFLKNDFENYNISTQNCDVHKGFASFSSYVILSDAEKSRTIVFDKGNIPKLELDNNHKEAILNSKLLMVDGNELDAALDAAKLARENNVDVLYDAGGLYENVEKMLEVANILIPSFEFATQITNTTDAPSAAKALYSKYNPDVVVITDGKNGGYMYNGAECVHYDAFSVNAVDTNGAGDVFHGAFAYALTHGFNFYQSCIFSSAVSALKCTKVGARAGVPQYSEVIEFLKERGYDEFEENMD